jgi:hypothetical protein
LQDLCRVRFLEIKTALAASGGSRNLRAENVLHDLSRLPAWSDEETPVALTQPASAQLRPPVGRFRTPIEVTGARHVNFARGASPACLSIMQSCRIGSMSVIEFEAATYCRNVSSGRTLPNSKIPAHKLLNM